MKILLFNINSGTGTEGTDYSTISDITISAGATTGTASFTPTDDSIYEGNETGVVAISQFLVDAAESGSQSVTITITENDSAPTVTLATSATSIAENAGSSLTLTATLSNATTADVTVGISTSGTGTEGTDYGTISDITISAGATTGTASLHQQMIVFMKETKLGQLQYLLSLEVSYRRWVTISNNYNY